MTSAIMQGTKLRADWFGKRGRPGAAITARELEIFAAYARCGSQKIVAAEFGIRLQSVKNAMSSVYGKLDVDNAIEALRALGWLTPPPVLS